MIHQMLTAIFVKGFYRGVVPATIRTAPHSAIMFSAYEYIRSVVSDTKL